MDLLERLLNGVRDLLQLDFADNIKCVLGHIILV
jgi:hypothetical protein